MLSKSEENEQLGKNPYPKARKKEQERTAFKLKARKME